MNLSIFNNNLFEAGAEFFSQLGIRLNSNTSVSLGARELLKDQYKDKGIFKAIAEAYFLGLVDDSVFDRNIPLLSKEKISLKEASEKINAEYNGLMVFAVKLNDSYSPARGDIAELTRAFNRASKNVPVVLLLKYGGLVSFAASERTKYKQAWREGEKIGKISLLKNINLKSPHTGHLKILDDLKVAPAVANFNALYKQWQEVFNVQLLNKKFYQELANWYFWALDNVEFPKGGGLDEKVRNAEAVIRLLTRLIFIWFIKEKRLVPDDLFIETRVRNLLKDLEPDNSTYYKAILQNLFFATLNTDPKETPRRWRGKNKGNGQDSHYLIPNVYRYKEEFHTPDEAFTLFKDIPFLNGGLFECLDKEVKDEDLKNIPELANLAVQEGKGRILRIDGFSERKENPLYFPNKLFFSNERTEDLNDIYGTKNKTYKVRGLINTLERYKFTVDENTPVEEEIALDPELLGKVFENLLASYTPETGTTARKQTGSFYTPREIVNYMVDESLIAYLNTALSKCHSCESRNPEAEQKIRHLLAYNDEPHKFTPAEVDILIVAINTLKALDPACGSGAFPMGMLHKLVYILGKLDPDNSKWREVQRQKAIKETEEAYKNEDKEEREKRLLDISEVFENNASDYGRKLYLIENCIFGVDIQPIAVQIAKLRFFISLIVDQQIAPKNENLGIRPLPNLETKFVAANTLIGIERPVQGMLRNPEIDKKEAKLKRVREKHFTARTLKTKRECREKDERLRAEISELLKQDGFPSDVTKKLVRWNPYDQNASAEFFDPEWMFGITSNSPLTKGDTGGCGGFDVVIANPPYVRADNPAIAEQRIKILNSKQYVSLWEKWDLYVAFIEKGFNMLAGRGILEFIIPDAYISSKYAEKSHAYFLNNAVINRINFCSELKIFEAAVKNIIIEYKKEINPNHIPLRIKHIDEWDNFIFLPSREQSEMGENTFKLDSENKTIGDLSNTLTWGEICYVSYGVAQSSDEIKYKGEFTKEDVLSDIKDKTHPFGYIEGKYIDKYVVKKIRYIEWGTGRSPEKWRRVTFSELYKPEKIMHGGMTGAILDKENLMCNHSMTVSVLWKDLKGVKNRSIEGSIKKDFKIKKVYPFRNKLEEISKLFNLKYLLAILNSKFACKFLDSVRRSQIGFYPDDLKKLPIKNIPLSVQQPFITLVDQILAAKKKDPNADTSALEQEIDKMVYELYGLTQEEVEIVDGRFKKADNNLTIRNCKKGV